MNQFIEALHRPERRYRRLDGSYVAIAQHLAQWAGETRGIAQAAALLLDWAEFRVNGLLRFQAPGVNEAFQRLEEARRGEDDLWFAATYSEIGAETFGFCSRPTLAGALALLNRGGILEVKDPTDRNLGKLYRLRIDRLSYLLEREKGQDLELIDDFEWGQQGVDHPDQSLYHPGQRDAHRPQEVVDRSPTSCSPIDREDLEIKEEDRERLLALFPGTEDSQAPERLLSRFSFSYLRRALVWARAEPFWSPKVSSLAGFERHFDSIRAQFPDNALASELEERLDALS